MDENKKTFLDADRVKELVLFIKTELAKKAGVTDLDDYVTSDDFATSLASQLTNYATTAAMNEAIGNALTAATKRILVDSLPPAAEADTKAIYFVPAPIQSEDQNIKEEYMVVNGVWEKLGTTRVDLSGYWAKADLTAMTADELTAILNS